MGQRLDDIMDATLDVLRPHPDASGNLLLAFGRVVYLPILIALGWQWVNLSGFLLEKKLGTALYRLAFSEVPRGIGVDADRFWVLPLHPEQLLWAILAGSVFTGWLLWRTTVGRVESRAEVLANFNMVGTGILLFVGLINLIQVFFITFDSLLDGLVLALCWMVVAGFLLRIFASD